MIVLRLFENTKYQVTEDISDEQVAYLEQMRKLLVSMADAAIRRNDLKSYLETLESDKIGWDIDDSFGNFPSIPTTVPLEDRRARHVSYLGYVPSVFLYSQSVVPNFAIEGEAFQIDFDKNPDALEQFFRGKEDLPRKNQLDVSVGIDFQVWFGIAPMDSSWTWEPVFEKRYLFTIRGFERMKRSIWVGSYDPSVVYRSVMPSGKLGAGLNWLRLFTLLPAPDGDGLSVSVSPHIDCFTESFGTDDVHREQLEGRWLIGLKNFDMRALDVDQDLRVDKGQFFYERVNLESCEKYLRQFSDPKESLDFEDECRGVELSSRLWSDSDQRDAWYSDFSSSGWPLVHASAPKGSIARAIELNLLQADSDHRLDTVLFETVAERVRNAHAYYQSVVEKRDRKITGLLKFWESF